VRYAFSLKKIAPVAKAVLLMPTERFEKPFASSLVAPPCQCLKHECAILRGVPGGLNSDGLRLGGGARGHPVTIEACQQKPPRTASSSRNAWGSTCSAERPRNSSGVWDVFASFRRSPTSRNDVCRLTERSTPYRGHRRWRLPGVLQGLSPRRKCDRAS
jgi:hypothetical protein